VQEMDIYLTKTGGVDTLFLLGMELV